MSFFGIYSVLLNLYLLRLGYDLAFIGLLNALGALMYGIFSLPSGLLGRRWGSRRMLILGMSVMLVGFTLLPLVEFIPDNLQAGWLLSTVVLAYFGGLQYSVNSKPYLMAASQSDVQGLAFSLHAAVLPLMAFVGSLAAGLLPGLFANVLNSSLDLPLPYRYSLFVGSLLFIPALIALLYTQKPPKLNPSGPALSGKRAPLATIGVMAFIVLLWSPSNDAVSAYINIYMDTELEISVALIGGLIAGGQLIAVPAALMMPWLANRWGRPGTVVLSFLGIVLSVSVLALIPHWAAAGFGYMGVLAFLGISRSVLNVFQMGIVAETWRSTMSGATAMASGFGGAAMIAGGSYLILTFGFRGFFLTVGGILLISLVVFQIYFRERV